MTNFELASIFHEIGELLEIKGENPFKVRSYYKAAQVLKGLPIEIKQLQEEGKLQDIPGVGEGIAKKIDELLTTGKLKYYEDLKAGFPKGLVKLLKIPEVGPKTVKLLYERLKIHNIEDLEKAIQQHKIKNLPGMGEKTEENIWRGIKILQKNRGRMPLGTALPIAKSILDQLKGLPYVNRISEAGSLRRMNETIGDIDILVSSNNPTKVMDKFVSLDLVKEILMKGKTKSSIITEKGLQVDLRVVNDNSYGAALQYFTGCKNHNIKLREMANQKGYKINEYGIFKLNTEEKIGGKEEKDIYNILNLPLIPAELRENKGEIEAALRQDLPDLLELSDIKGDFHVHSNWSDGAHTIKEIAEYAQKIGYEYVAMCDHSQSLKVANGLSEDDLKRKIDEIRELNLKMKNFTILAGTEVDIKSDGSLDYPDHLLKKLDLVIAAIHMGMKESKEQITKRIIAAMNNKFVHIIAHPTGRLINQREAYQIDMEKVFEEAVKTQTCLELNAFPDRLDLNDTNCQKAKYLGVKIALGTDAHNKFQLNLMNYGVATARRGWLEAKDILNTLSVKELLKIIKR